MHASIRVKSQEPAVPPHRTGKNAPFRVCDHVVKPVVARAEIGRNHALHPIKSEYRSPPILEQQEIAILLENHTPRDGSLTENLPLPRSGIVRIHGACCNVQEEYPPNIGVP